MARTKRDISRDDFSRKRRWHLTCDEIEKIRGLTKQRVRQWQIARRLHIGRDTVGMWQRRLGLPTVPPIPEKKILRLFSKGWGGYRISKRLGVPANRVYEIAHKHEISNGWAKTPAKNEARFIEALRRREDYTIRLARKYNVAICRARRIAHEVLGTVEFRPGLSKPPLSSVYPQRHFQRELVN